MSRCATTPSVLEARFAEVDLTRDQAAHVAACAECARAFALLRRFDADLESIGHDLAPERAGDVRELMRMAVPEEGSTVSWHRGLIGVAAVAVVLIVVTGALFLGDRSFGADVGRVFGLGMDRSEAAAALGLPEDAVVMVGGDAVGLRVREGGASATLELLVVEASDRRVRQVYEDQLDIRPDSGGVYLQPVRCFGLLEEDVHAIMALGWSSGLTLEVGRAGIGGIPGRHVVFETSNDRTALLFVADAESVAADNSYLLDMGTGAASGTIEDHEENCAQPATAACGDWSEWSAGTRASMTEWLTETRLDAVRVAQQMPPNSTEAEVVDAAVSSIDKNCQGSPPDMRLMQVVERLYD